MFRKRYSFLLYCHNFASFFKFTHTKVALRPRFFRLAGSRGKVFGIGLQTSQLSVEKEQKWGLEPQIISMDPKVS